MTSAWALIPIKPFAVAKTRLEGVLSRGECAGLAEHMARDVLRALTANPGITGITLLSNEPRLDQMAETSGARRRPEPPDSDYRLSLGTAAAELAARGVRALLVLPADLPTLSGADLAALLAGHRGGVTVCPARDGGTNALLLSPPDAIPFFYGKDSARQHLAAAAARGLTATRLELPAFARDIDNPDDVLWLLDQRLACATTAWLVASGIAGRLKPGRRNRSARQPGDTGPDTP